MGKDGGCGKDVWKYVRVWGKVRGGGGGMV